MNNTFREKVFVSEDFSLNHKENELQRKYRFWGVYGKYLSCQDNDYSLVESLIFIDLQDYRYRTINRCINCYHMEESHIDVITNIALVVESEKSVISGQSSCGTIIKNYISFP